jgi:polysaccharide export outer membrane protein
MALLAYVVVALSSPSLAQVSSSETLLVQERDGNRFADSADAYTLGGGDLIQIDILDVPQYSGQYQIPIDGTINLPLIGSVNVEGLSLAQASQKIETEYLRVLKRSEVTVSLVAPRPLNIWISGEVNRPGSYALRLTPGAGNIPGVQYPTVVQAIETAKGITLAADIRQIQVRRYHANQERVFYVDLWKMLQTGDRGQDLILRDGDAIFIPTATEINLNELRQLSKTSFARDIEEPRMVTVIGEVQRPGSYIVLGGDTGTGIRAAGLPTVMRALQLAGGITSLADIRQIQIRRPTQSGSNQIIELDFWQLLHTGDVAQDTIVQDGDTIVIPKVDEINPAEAAELANATFAPDKIEVNVVGEVINPGSVSIAPNTPLNQALLAAGGFKPGRAKSDTVELIRLNPDGTVARQTVPVNFEEGINEQTNPILRDRDIVVVSANPITRFADNVNSGASFGVSALSILRILDFLGIISP